MGVRSDVSPAANTALMAGGPPRPSPSQKQLKSKLLISTAVCAAGLSVSLAAVFLVRAGDSDARGAKPEPGVTYSNDKVARVPWSIHIVKIDRSRKDLTFFSAPAKDKVLGVGLIAEQARAIPREIV